MCFSCLQLFVLFPGVFPKFLYQEPQQQLKAEELHTKP